MPSAAVLHIHLRMSSKAGCKAHSLCTDKGESAAAEFADPSDNSAIRNDAILDDNHNTILDDKTQVLSVGLLDVALIGDADITANPSIFVNNGLAHNSISTCKQGQGAVRSFVGEVKVT